MNMILLGVVESKEETISRVENSREEEYYASAMGTMDSPWYESTRNDLEETRE